MPLGAAELQELDEEIINEQLNEGVSNAPSYLPQNMLNNNSQGGQAQKNEVSEDEGTILFSALRLLLPQRAPREQFAVRHPHRRRNHPWYQPGQATQDEGRCKIQSH